MKIPLYDLKGNKKSEIEMPEIFNTPIREDIIQKYFESEKFSKIHPYRHNEEAGKRHSASGTISHRRHEWKGHYGKGYSRVPRKAMWRRGTQFYWIGAEVSSTRGGRRVHGPVGSDRKPRKINRREAVFALSSAIAATANSHFIKKRYSSISDLPVEFPIVLDYAQNAKTKDIISAMKGIFGKIYSLVLKRKAVRAGKGKQRGRKYKSSAGILLVKSKNEKFKMKGIDIKSSNEIEVSDFYPLGRLVVYTQKSLAELGALK